MQRDVCMFRRHAWTYVGIPIRPPKQDAPIGQVKRVDLILPERVPFHAQACETRRLLTYVRGSIDTTRVDKSDSSQSAVADATMRHSSLELLDTDLHCPL